MRANPLMRVAIRLTGAAIVVAGFLQLSNAHAYKSDEINIHSKNVMVITFATTVTALTVGTA